MQKDIFEQTCKIRVLKYFWQWHFFFSNKILFLKSVYWNENNRSIEILPDPLFLWSSSSWWGSPRTFRSGTQFESPFPGTSLKTKPITTTKSQQLTYSHRAFAQGLLVSKYLLNLGPFSRIQKAGKKKWQVSNGINSSGAGHNVRP